MGTSVRARRPSWNCSNKMVGPSSVNRLTNGRWISFTKTCPARPVRDGVTVYERCLLSTRHVFWEYLRTKKLVTAEEDSVYQNAYERYLWHPDVYIFLAKSPKTAFEHIQKRKQVGDSRVTLKYLEELHVLYEKMLMNIPCKVHVVSTEGRTPDEVYAEVSMILSRYTVKDKNGVYCHNSFRSKVSQRASVPCTQIANVCRLS